MRTIKFRAWNGKEIINDALKADASPAESFSGVDLPAYRNISYLTCSPLELMQFTGLTDINGVEIYENDVLRCEHENLWLVGFHDRGTFVAHEKNDIDDFVLLDDYDFTVIGNIYQNQELLK